MPPSALRLLTPLLLLATSSAAASWDCHNIVLDNKDFNLGELAGPKEVHWIQETPPSFVNTTFTVDICDPLPKKDGECPEGTHICGIQRTYHPDDKETPKADKVIPIAGPFTDDSKPKIKKLEKDDSDKQKGLRIELGGGKYLEKAQKAILELVCDPDLTGSEGFDKKEKREDEKQPDLDAGKSLQFDSYKVDGSDADVLTLKWKTKFACEGAADASPGKKGGWGFFTWFLIIGFLLAASYIIFGSWLNYQRYGSKGFDLIPHSDTIRDLPYLFKEWLDRFRSGGSRGGYSAV